MNDYCWPCRHYRAAYPPMREAISCELDLVLFPHIGRKCVRFDYEPGSDYAEMVEETKADIGGPKNPDG